MTLTRKDEIVKQYKQWILKEQVPDCLLNVLAYLDLISELRDHDIHLDEINENEKYINEHKYCPKCGSTKVEQFLRAYRIINGKILDDNKCLCHDCQWEGIVDEKIAYDIKVIYR